jgi:hypothetical protein
MSTGTEKKLAANEARQFLNKLKNLLAVAGDLDKLGSVEVAMAELDAKRSALERERETVVAEVGAAKAKAAGIVEQATADAQALRDEAAAEREAATKDAAALVARAKIEAANVVAAAKTERTAIENEIRASVSQNVDEILKCGRAA